MFPALAITLSRERASFLSDLGGQERLMRCDFRNTVCSDWALPFPAAVRCRQRIPTNEQEYALGQL
jgi:hypothetical protein